MGLPPRQSLVYQSSGYGYALLVPLFAPRPSQDDVAKLTRHALTPMGEPLGLDYSYAAATRPTTEDEVAFEALRVGAALLVAFCDPPSWGEFNDRKTRKLARRGAADLFSKFSGAQGQAAISWLTQSYGAVLAAQRRAAAAEETGEKAANLEATAETDDWLSAIVGERWPVDSEGAIKFADEVWWMPEGTSDPEPWVVSMSARLSASIEAISVALWPDCRKLQPVFFEWTGVGLESAQQMRGISSDWRHVAPQWANLLQPERRSYIELMESAGDH